MMEAVSMSMLVNIRLPATKSRIADASNADLACCTSVNMLHRGTKLHQGVPSGATAMVDDPTSPSRSKPGRFDINALVRQALSSILRLD